MYVCFGMGLAYTAFIGRKIEIEMSCLVSRSTTYCRGSWSTYPSIPDPKVMMTIACYPRE